MNGWWLGVSFLFLADVSSGGLRMNDGWMGVRYRTLASHWSFSSLGLQGGGWRSVFCDPGLGSWGRYFTGSDPGLLTAFGLVSCCRSFPIPLVGERPASDRPPPPALASDTGRLEGSDQESPSDGISGR